MKGARITYLSGNTRTAPTIAIWSPKASGHNKNILLVNFTTQWMSSSVTLEWAKFENKLFFERILSTILDFYEHCMPVATMRRLPSIIYPSLIRDHYETNMRTRCTTGLRHIGQLVIELEQLKQQHTWPQFNSTTSDCQEETTKNVRD